MKRCRHRHGWFIASGVYEWCYQCGALRKLDTVDGKSWFAVTQWTRPTGPEGKNPWPMKETRA